VNGSSPPLLAVRNLCVRFRLRGRSFRAVDDVSLDVSAGETVAVVGESGCGKTTLALALLRLLPLGAVIESGSIRLRERELTGLSEKEMRDIRGKDAGMIFQEPLTALNPVYTVGEQIAEGLRLHEGLGRRAARQRAIDTLAEVGVPDPSGRASAYPHQLSGGQRQRAMIATAIACRPALLIADEPTTALDVGVQGQILDLLRKLQAERALAILLITHDLGVVAEMAQRVAVMYAGQIVEQADVRSLFAEPLHPYTRGLLGCLPRLEAPPPGTRRLPVLEGTVPDLSQLPSGCRFANRCSDVVERCGQAQGLRPVASRLVRCIQGEEKPA
jgi:peptide/nickel transport system ATP-binding protein